MTGHATSSVRAKGGFPHGDSPFVFLDIRLLRGTMAGATTTSWSPMRILALVAALFLSACAANPKRWIPSAHSTPPGVTQGVWAGCWNTREADARRLLGTRYNNLSTEQKQCLLMRLAEDCVYHGIRLLETHAPHVAARCNIRDFQEFITEAMDAYCGSDDDGPGGGVVMDMYLYVRKSAVGGGTLNRDACPAQ